MCELILIRGLPGSGKSTMANDLAVQYDAECLEADMYFIARNGEYIFDATKLGSAHQWCQDLTEFFLRKRSTVIVSNTFTTEKELRPYFEIAIAHGIIPQVILLQNDFGSVHDVPEETILKMKSRFQYDISGLWKEFTL